MPKTEERPVHILLLENQPESAQRRAEVISLFQHPSRIYRVRIASNRNEAQSLIDEQRFEFMLVDLLLRPDSSADTVAAISDEQIDDEENGVQVAKDLLHYHRTFYGEKPNDSHQLRSIIYSSAPLEESDLHRLRVKILCSGACDVISRAAPEMQDMLESLGDLCDLQEEMNEVIAGHTWMSKVVNSLGVGISIIGKNQKIWYCSPKNMGYSGLKPEEFHDRVCWLEYHDFQGLFSSCPECPADMVINGRACTDPEARKYACITRRYPFSQLERSCAHEGWIGKDCSAAGKAIESYSNCRLLPIDGKDLKWVHVMGAPIDSADGSRVIGAVETVIDLDRAYKGYWEQQILAGKISAKELLEPALHIVNWLGYSRAQVFRLSDGGEELVGISQIDGQSGGDFSGQRIPIAGSLVACALQGDPRRSAVSTNLEFGRGRLDREDDCQTMEFVFRDSRDNSVVGTLLVDDFRRQDTPATSEFSANDLGRLQQVADYMAHIIALQKEYDDRAALRRAIDNMRSLEVEAETSLGSVKDAPLEQQAEDLRVFLATQLRLQLSQEPDLVGFHLRFLRDGQLHLYQGLGVYSREGKTEPISPDDPQSLSAECFRTGQCCIRAADSPEFPEFRAFYQKVRDSQMPMEKKHAVLEWCDSVNMLGCFPIYFGKRGLGTLAIQSRASDFFKSKAKDFITGVCNVLARVLGPIAQEQYYHEFHEGTAYAFYGPASNLRDIAHNHWLSEDDPQTREIVEGEYALAWLLVTKANNFFRANRPDQPVVCNSRDVPLRPLWNRWCAIFRGICQYTNKQVALEILQPRDEPAIDDIEIHGDAMLLSEIVYNIFENAWKACEDTVIVSAACMEGKFVVDVKDNGAGIPDAFTSCEQGGPAVEADPSIWSDGHQDFETGTNKGFGLGLKWSKKYADLMGVRLRAFPHGGINGGAHFQIIIPAEGESRE